MLSRGLRIELGNIGVLLRNTERILKHGLAGILPVVRWVLAVLQVSLTVQIVIHALRVLEVLD